MKMNGRSLLYSSVFVLLLLLAGYPHVANVLGQTIPTGQITVIKQHLQHSVKSFEFAIEPVGGGIAVKFKLKDGESKTVSVSPGSYVIREESSGNNLVNILCAPSGGTVPGGTVPDDEHKNPHSVKVTVTSGGAVSCTFQNSYAVRIRVLKYNDVNGNGTRNSGEKFLKNWVFTVYSSTGVAAHPKKTNSAGRVKFESLAPGSYVVCETLRDGWTNTQPGGTSYCYSMTLTAGQEALLLFGNHKTQKDDVDDNEGVDTNDADRVVNAALAADGIEIVNNPDEVYSPAWDDAPDATLVYNTFMPYVSH